MAHNEKPPAGGPGVHGAAASETVLGSLNAGEAAAPALSPLKAIRAKCLHCSAGQPREVRLCAMTWCALWPFRMGENPHRNRRKLTPDAKAALSARLAAGRADCPQPVGKIEAGGNAGGGGA
jgi:hypothetical protein